MQRHVKLAFHLPFPGSLYKGWLCITGMGVAEPTSGKAPGHLQQRSLLCFKLETCTKGKEPKQSKAPSLPLPRSLCFLCELVPVRPPIFPSPSPPRSPSPPSWSEKTHLASCIYKVVLQCRCSFRTLWMPFTVPTITNHATLLSKHPALEKSLPWWSWQQNLILLGCLLVQSAVSNSLCSGSKNKLN